ncbi:MAG: TPM domain-containing protein [Acidobacteriota bacterium]
MSRLTRGLGLSIALGLVLASVAAALDAPALTGRVVDGARLLDADQHVALEQKLADFEQKTGVQVAVLTVESLEGDTIEAFSMRVAEAWKLGQKERDNGVLFTIAKDDRKMRIEVGYGLESKLTDATSGRILDNVVRPQFRAGDFPGGVDRGVDAILGSLEGVAGAVPQAAASPQFNQGPLSGRLAGFGIYLLVTGVFSLFALFSKGGEAWLLYFFLIPFHLLFPMILHPLAGVVLCGLWVVGFPIVRLIMKLTGRIDRFFPKWDPSSWKNVSSGGGGWSSGGGFSSGGSSGGGFSGGGGSFGGGGSSGSW